MHRTYDRARVQILSDLLALGWENYDCVAMGNKIIAGKYPISYSNANNVRLEYNTIVNPQSALMRILSESVVATNPSSNGVYSHNLVVYGSVGEYVNESPSNINPGSFTFDGNYWYRTTNPAASRPPLPGTQINDAGGVDPQLSPSYDPQYEPAKAYGAGAPGLDAAWLPHVGKFQWAWNTVQTYLPQARPVVLAATGGVVLDASASAPGVNSYGSNTLQSYGWDIDNDGDVDLACTGTCALSNAQLRDQYGLLPGNHSVGLIVSVLTELGAVVVSKESMTTLTVAPMAGDANSDGVVDQADYTIWYNHYGQTPATWADGDVTGDNIVDQADYTVWYNHYGQTGSNVPEPMTMALLAIGGVAMLRRRKGSSLSFEGRTDPGPADRVRGRTLSIPKTPSGCQTVAE